MRFQTSKTKNAESFYIVESTYVNGRRSNKIVKKLGTLKQIKEMLGPDVDPYEWGREQAELMTRQNAEDEEDNTDFTLSPSKALEKDKINSFSLGYLFLQKIYYELGINNICSKIRKKYKYDFNLDSILSILIYGRVLSPASKRSTYDIAQSFVESPKFELHHIYRALEVLAKESDFIQSEVYKSSKSICRRHDEVLYYDCTNYFFEIEKEDEFRKYGHSKEHRPNPIVQMGLFMDSNGIPLAFNVMPGNTNEQTMLKPLEQKILKDFGISDCVVCTDAGLASTDNRKFNAVMGRGFVVTQSLKKLKDFIQDWALDTKGFHIGHAKKIYDISTIDEDEFYDTVFWKEQWIKENDLEQRLIVTYSPKYARYTKELRERHVKKAEYLIAKNSKSLSNRGGSDIRDYVSSISVTNNGEIADKTIYYINEDAINDDERFDGFYAACTNLDEDIDTLMKVMKGRWEIEECFRIMKTDFEARPVYLSREDRIKAHFLTCFLALLLYRILENRIQQKCKSATLSKILNTLQNMNVVLRRDMYIPSYTRNDITDILHDISGFRTDVDVISAKKMRKIIKLSKCL